MSILGSQQQSRWAARSSLLVSVVEKTSFDDQNGRAFHILGIRIRSGMGAFTNGTRPDIFLEKSFDREDVHSQFIFVLEPQIKLSTT